MEAIRCTSICWSGISLRLACWCSSSACSPAASSLSGHRSTRRRPTTRGAVRRFPVHAADARVRLLSSVLSVPPMSEVVLITGLSAISGTPQRLGLADGGSTSSTATAPGSPAGDRGAWPGPRPPVAGVDVLDDAVQRRCLSRRSRASMAPSTPCPAPATASGPVEQFHRRGPPPVRDQRLRPGPAVPTGAARHAVKRSGRIVNLSSMGGA